MAKKNRPCRYCKLRSNKAVQLWSRNRISFIDALKRLEIVSATSSMQDVLLGYDQGGNDRIAELIAGYVVDSKSLFYRLENWRRVALFVRFEGLGLQAQPSPNRPTAAAARQLRAPRARFCSAAADLTPVCGCFGAPKIANITG